MILSKQEQTVLDEINEIVTVNRTVNILMMAVSRHSSVTGKQFSGIISSLQRKKLIETDGYMLTLLNHPEFKDNRL
jgi:hypothetical protein